MERGKALCQSILAECQLEIIVFLLNDPEIFRKEKSRMNGAVILEDQNL